MTSRPLPILFLILCHLLEPFFKGIVLSIYYGMTFSDYIGHLFLASGAVELFFYFLFMPLLGLMLLKARSYTFFIFLITHLTIVLGHIADYQELYLTGYTRFMYIMMMGDFLNIVMIAILLLPKVRLAFFDYHVRWWETAPRYDVTIPTKILDLDMKKEMEGTILNISDGGAFLRLGESPPKGSLIELTFLLFEQEIDITAEVRHYYQDDQDDKDYTGVKFLFEDKDQMMLMKNLMGVLKNQQSSKERKPKSFLRGVKR